MSFLAELKRRNVIRMAGLYSVGAWLLIQIARNGVRVTFEMGSESLSGVRVTPDAESRRPENDSDPISTTRPAAQNAPCTMAQAEPFNRWTGAHDMGWTKLLAVTLLAAWGSPVWAQPPSPAPLLPEAFTWFGPPNNPGLRAAWVIGTESGQGAYLLRVRLAKGARIPPHTHPDERNSTVLSGTLYVGFGDVADDARLVAIPAGGVYVAPANVPHYLWAKDGDVVYQESGMGPTFTTPIKS